MPYYKTQKEDSDLSKKNKKKEIASKNTKKIEEVCELLNELK